MHGSAFTTRPEAFGIFPPKFSREPPTRLAQSFADTTVKFREIIWLPTMEVFLKDFLRHLLRELVALGAQSLAQDLPSIL